MGLTDLISNALFSKKSPTLTSKSKTSKSMVLQSKSKRSNALVSKSKNNDNQESESLKYRNNIPKGDALPNSWNKDGFHLVSIRSRRNEKNYADFKSYPGYIWVTDNWVEIHCFDHEIMKKENFKTGKSKGYWSTHPMTTQGATIGVMTEYVTEYEYCEKDIPAFNKIVISAIVPRKYVSVDILSGTIFVHFTTEDFARWRKWHPKNDYRTTLPEQATCRYYWNR